MPISTAMIAASSTLYDMYSMRVINPKHVVRLSPGKIWPVEHPKDVPDLFIQASDPLCFYCREPRRANGKCPNCGGGRFA